MPAKALKQPRTQEQRSADTRQRILEATIALLVEVGYARTSTWAVCERAGVSRGALLHHFPTRISLFVTAVSYLASIPLDQLDTMLAKATPEEGVGVFMDWLWSTLEGDLFSVGLELIAAARTEPELKDVLRTGGDIIQKRLAGAVHGIVKACDAPKGGELEALLLMAIPAVRGIGLDLAIGGDRSKHARAWRELGCKLQESVRSQRSSASGRPEAC